MPSWADVMPQCAQKQGDWNATFGWSTGRQFAKLYVIEVCMTFECLMVIQYRYFTPDDCFVFTIRTKFVKIKVFWAYCYPTSAYRISVWFIPWERTTVAVNVCVEQISRKYPYQQGWAIMPCRAYTPEISVPAEVNHRVMWSNYAGSIRTSGGGT